MEYDGSNQEVEKPLLRRSRSCLKNENFGYHFAVGVTTNRGGPPWPVSSPATFAIIRKPTHHS